MSGWASFLYEAFLFIGIRNLNMEFDRTLLTENYLVAVINCIENHGYDVADFEFSTQRTHSYTKGVLDPKAIVYVCRISTGIEMNYVLGEGPDFSGLFCDDLIKGTFDK